MGHQFKAMFEMLRGDAGAARQAAETVVQLRRDHGLALFLSREGRALVARALGSAIERRAHGVAS